MGRFFIFLLVILLLLPVGLAALVLPAIEDEPLVSGKPVPNTESASRVRTLAHKFRNAQETDAGKKELAITEQDLASIIVFAVRSVPSARAEAQITPQGLEGRLTVGLPRTPLGRYANLGFTILPSEHGLEIESIRFGQAEYSARFLAPAMSRGLDLLLGSGSGEMLMGFVSSVRFKGGEMILTYEPGQGRSEKLSDRMNTLFDKIKNNDQLRIAHPETVQIYFRHLQETAVQLRGGYVPLSKYIAPVFRLAAESSKPGEDEAATQNRAAIMALAVYFGDQRMKALVDSSTENYFSGSRYGSHNVTIQGRHDLVQHYLTSAGLQLAAGVNVANVIGEFKEIADTLRGGSGFSFSDIAADRAGVVLAQKAGDAKHAYRMQAVLSRVKQETDYFPDISGLPDNMTQAEFESRYGNVDSARYRSLMADIERRIASVPAYGGE